MLLKEVIQKTTAFFKEKGIASPRLDTEILLAKALGWDRMKLYLNYDYPLTEAELQGSRALVKRRLAGEPVAYILGAKDFYKSTFIVNSAVLIPRPETEELVEAVVMHFKPQVHDEEGVMTTTELPTGEFWIVDLGTGSGCIGLSLLKELPQANLIAVDISAEALEVAKQNAASLGLSERIVFLHKDAAQLTAEMIFNLTDGNLATVVVANPPYIAEDDPTVEKNVREFEPSVALFSKEKGLSHIREWASAADKISEAGALIIFEIGFTQGAEAAALFSQGSAANFKNIGILKDLSGHERFIRAVKGPQSAPEKIQAKVSLHG